MKLQRDPQVVAANAYYEKNRDKYSARTVEKLFELKPGQLVNFRVNHSLGRKQP